MTNQPYIFLSYRTNERNFALKLATDLKNSGVHIWMDILDIKPGDDWMKGLQDAIDTCVGMIAVLSPDYIASKYCRRELKRADSRGIPIYPIMLRALKDEQDWPLEIQEKQYISFVDWQDNSGYRNQFDTLMNVLHQKFPSQIGDAPDLETQYLTSFVADLESKRGVLEYVELSGVAQEIRDVRPQLLDDEWGFSALIPEDDKSDENKKFPLQGISEAINRFPKFVLIGEPGSGKTTTLRKLASETAYRRLSTRDHAPIPILLYLPQWNDEPTPLDFVRSNWSLKGNIVELLKSGEVVLYLDGLNELGAKAQERAKQLTLWLSSNDNCKYVIVTCRAEDYKGELKLGKTPTVIADELNNEQIHEFVMNYLGDKTNSFLSLVIPENEIQRKTPRSMLNLVRNPYMLSALTYIYDRGATGDLPRNMGTLFQRLVLALWKREQQRNTVGNLNFTVVERAFAKLAFSMIEAGTSTDVSRDYAIEQVESERMLLAGSNANYISLSGDNVRFYHQLLQEYFAASFLSTFDSIDLVSLIGEPEFDQFGERKSGKWDNVIVALAGISARYFSWIEDLIHINPMLATECHLNGRPLSHDLYRLLVSKLKDMSGNASFYTLLSLRDNDLLEYLTIRMRHASRESSRSYRTEGVVKIYGTAAIPFLCKLARNCDHWAAYALEQIGESNNEIIDALIAGFQSERCNTDFPEFNKDDDLGRQYFTDALVKLRDDRVVRFFISILENEVPHPHRPDMVTFAIQALGKMNVEEAIPLFIQFLPHALHDQYSENDLVTGFQNLDKDAKYLISAMSNANPAVRAGAIIVARRVANPRLVPHLTKLLSDNESFIPVSWRKTPAQVKDYAISALKWMRIPEATTALENWERDQRSH
jgi:hypothetical protein